MSWKVYAPSLVLLAVGVLSPGPSCLLAVIIAIAVVIQAIELAARYKDE